MNMIITNLKVWIWNIVHMPLFRFRYWQTRALRRDLQIKTSLETVEQIIQERCSVCRFGDGEFQMMIHYLKKGNNVNFNIDTFQNYDEQLAMRLVEVFRSSMQDILICIPYQFKDSSISRFKHRIFWEREWLSRKDFLLQAGIDKAFGDSTFTRFYLDRKDIRDYRAYVKKLQSIWYGRELVIIEGEFSRLGIGNDLFETATSVERIICPATNAFQIYGDILTVMQAIDPSKLVLIALGHTATVLAYDLALAGYQAIDIGHVDIEYEWYKMGAKTKMAIANKYVNEVESGRIENSDLDITYEQQIKHRIAPHYAH